MRNLPVSYQIVIIELLYSHGKAVQIMRTKCIILTGLLFLIPCMVHAQGITIGSGTTLSLGSATVTVTGGWLNEGTFDAGNSTVLFSGASGDQTIQNVAGDTFNNLTINKASGDLMLLSDIEVTGALTISGGNLNIQEKAVTLGSSAVLVDTPGARIKGTSGAITVTKDLNAPDNEDIAGLGLKLTSATNLGATTITRSHITQTASGNSTILRYYDISAANTAGMNATLVISYDESDLNGLPESSLRILRSTDMGTSFNCEGGVIDTDNNTATLNGVSAFSRWTLGASEPPILSDLEESPVIFCEDYPPQHITRTLSIHDTDDINIESATVQIAGEYRRDEDVLLFTNSGGITGNWDEITGTLTLSGTATIEEYQQALREVTYNNTRAFPSSANRTFIVTVNDGTMSSNQVLGCLAVDPYPDPLIEVLSPNGIEHLTAGASHEITWNAVMLDRGKIELSLDGGTNWQTITDNVDLSTGSYQWNVPAGSSSDCLIRITSIETPRYNDLSNTPFTIAGDCPVIITDVAHITQLSPGQYDLQLRVETSDADIRNVRFVPYTVTGDSVCVTEEWYGNLDTDTTLGIDVLTVGTSEVPVSQFNIPVSSDTVTIGISGIYVNGTYYQTTFEYTAAAACDLLEPNITGTLSPGSVQQITWHAELLDRGRIELSMDGGDSWQMIADDVELSAGSFLWTVPDGASPDCLIRITSIEKPGYSDVSEQCFCIDGTCPVAITDIAGFIQVTPECYEIQFSVETAGSGTVSNVRFVPYVEIDASPFQVDEWYGSRDSDGISGIDIIPGGAEIVTVCRFDLPASTDVVTIGATGIYIDGAYYRINFECPVNTACAPPTVLTVRNMNGENVPRIALTWELSPNDDNVLEYRIYRSRSEEWAAFIDIATLSSPTEIADAEQSAPLYLGSVLKGVNAFDDTNSADLSAAYYYWVEAVSAFRTSDKNQCHASSRRCFH